MTETNYFQFPKSLLLCSNYKSLKLISRNTLDYLMSLSNTFQSPNFWIKPKKLADDMNVGRTSLERARKELTKLGIFSYTENKKWIIDMTAFFEHYKIISPKERDYLTKMGGYLPKMVSTI